MPEILELLQSLGFGEYEARAYVALLRRSPVNGYELAKESGLPRANVYSVLDRLEERGAVVRLDTPSGTRYSAVPPAELVGRIGSKFTANLSAAQRVLNEIAAPPSHEYVWNTHGYQPLLDHARTLIDGAQHSLLVATWTPEAQALASDLAAAEERGVEVITLCLQGCPAECGGCRGAIFRYRLAPEYDNRWLVVVQDDSEAMAGEIGPGDEALTVRTRQRLLVELSAWYIRHSIALAGVVGDLGDQLPHLLSPQTLSALASLGPGGYHQGEQVEDGTGSETGWLGYMQQALGRR